jgi:hypothetical protein
LSSVALSDFYEAFDFLEQEEKGEESIPEFYKVDRFVLLHVISAFFRSVLSLKFLFLCLGSILFSSQELIVRIESVARF